MICCPHHSGQLAALERDKLKTARGLRHFDRAVPSCLQETLVLCSGSIFPSNFLAVLFPSLIFLHDCLGVPG